MIDYNPENNIKLQTEKDYEELELYKNAYDKRVKVYDVYLNTVDVFQNDDANGQNISNKLNECHNQIEKINNALSLLNEIKNNEETIEKEKLDDYANKMKEIKDCYIRDSISEDDMRMDCLKELLSDFSNTIETIKDNHIKEIQELWNENDRIKKIEETKEVSQEEESVQDVCPQESQVENNDTLLISEVLGKVILPYTGKEVEELYNNNKNKYYDYEDVIKKEFTRDFCDYKIQFTSRYNETMKLARKKEQYGLSDSIALAVEMMKKRYLHPAIISACRTLNELDVYLDCLDKNELDDFKIFKIKYELYPMVVKKNRNRNRNKNKVGKRYKEEYNYRFRFL